MSIIIDGTIVRRLVLLCDPLLLFNPQGDCLGAKLRPGNVHSAAGPEPPARPDFKRRAGRGMITVGLKIQNGNYR